MSRQQPLAFSVWRVSRGPSRLSALSWGLVSLFPCSDYASVDEAKAAIDRYFTERNAFFRDTEYVCQDLEAYEAAYRQRVVKAMARKAAALGYRLEPVPAGS